MKTRKDLQDEKYELEELINICEEKGLEGVITNVDGKTEFWYKTDMENWIDDLEFKINNECEEVLNDEL